MVFYDPTVDGFIDIPENSVRSILKNTLREFSLELAFYLRGSSCKLGDWS
jgi:hypothetical protein